MHSNTTTPTTNTPADLTTMTDAELLAHFSSITPEQAENDDFDRAQAARSDEPARVDPAVFAAALANLAANPVQYPARTNKPRAVRGRR